MTDMRPDNTGDWSGLPAWGLAALTAFLTLYVMSVCTPPVFDPRYSIYLDITNIYWIQNLADKAALRGDEIVELYFGRLWGFYTEHVWIFLTSLFARVTPYTDGIKVLSLLAAVASALMLRRVSMVSAAAPAAGAAQLLFVALFLSMESFFGIPRVYGVLVILGAVLAIESRRFALAPFLAVAGFVFYPASSAGLWASCAALPYFYREEFSAGRLWPGYLRSLAAAAVLQVLVAARSSVVIMMDLSRLPAFESGKFYNMVSDRLSQFNPVDALSYFILNLNDHTRLYVIMFFLLLLVCGLGLMVSPRRPRLMPRSVLVLFSGCSAAFLCIYPFHAVTASRQMVIAVPLVLVFWAAESLRELVGTRRRVAGTAVFIAALFAALHPWYGDRISMRDYSPVYEFLSSRPASEVTAGYPDSWLIYTVPVFSSRRAALTDMTFDQQMIFLRGPEEFYERRRALIEALYCASPGASENLASGYGVTMLLAEKKYYEPEFIEQVSAGTSPSDRSTAEVLRSAPSPAACYDSLSSAASFHWKKGDAEGIAVPIGAGGGAIDPSADKEARSPRPGNK